MDRADCQWQGIAVALLVNSAISRDVKYLAHALKSMS